MVSHFIIVIYRMISYNIRNYHIPSHSPLVYIYIPQFDIQERDIIVKVVNDRASIRTKLAVHSTGNSPGHSLGHPRPDCMLAIYSTIYNTGLCKPKERVEFDQHYLSEKQHATWNVFASYMRELLYILLHFQVSEMLYRGPKFLL